MRKIVTILFILAIPYSHGIAQTDIPRVISYVGVLSDRDGRPLNGTQKIEFQFSDPSGKNLRSPWIEVYDSVQVNGGVFGVQLGRKQGWLPEDIDQSYNLRIKLYSTNDVVVVPMYSVPFALTVADRAVTTMKIRDSSITPSKLSSPQPIAGKDQTLVYNGDKKMWEHRVLNDSTVVSINGIQGKMNLSDDESYIVALKNTTTDPGLLQLRFGGIREVDSAADVSLTLTQSSDRKGKKLTATLQRVPLSVIEKDKANDGDVMQYSKDLGWQPVDTKTMMPVGSVVAFAGSLDKIPNKWLPCDGRSVRKSDYPDLAGVLGTNFGTSGDGVRIPDMRGRFLRGLDSTVPTAAVRPLVTGRDPDSGKRLADTAGLGGRFADANSGNNVGSVQADAFQGHVHEGINRVSGFEAGRAGDGRSAWGFKTDRRWEGQPSGYPMVLDNKTDFTDIGRNIPEYNNPRVAFETRPTNVTIIYIIKVLP